MLTVCPPENTQCPYRLQSGTGAKADTAILKHMPDPSGIYKYGQAICHSQICQPVIFSNPHYNLAKKLLLILPEFL